jgi:lipopolysaccharide transport system permease protein
MKNSGMRIQAGVKRPPLEAAPELVRSDNLPVFRIAPAHGWASLKLHKLWEYRELFYFLVWRDIKVRYKQTILGAAWAIIQPFVTICSG